MFLLQFINYYCYYHYCLHVQDINVCQITTTVLGQLQNYIKAQEKKIKLNVIQQIKIS